MLVRARFGPEWRDMTTGAICLAAENGLATLCGRVAEIHFRSGCWGRQRQLVVLQSEQLGSDLVVGRINRSVAKSGGCGNGPAIGVVQSLVEKVSFATHFQDGDQRVPIGHGTPTACPGMEIVTEQAESIRNEC